MKLWLAGLLPSLTLLFCAVPGLTAAQDIPVTFSIRLIRGTDDAAPPKADAHPAEPQISHRLEMFRWKKYWEMRRETISLREGGKSRVHLTPKRDVEVRRGPKDVTISIYADGKLTRRRTQPLDRVMYIAGGERDDAECWFVVVQREAPQGR